jgi:hypothetical protein
MEYLTIFFETLQYKVVLFSHLMNESTIKEFSCATKYVLL